MFRSSHFLLENLNLLLAFVEGNGLVHLVASARSEVAQDISHTLMDIPLREFCFRGQGVDEFVRKVGQGVQIISFQTQISPEVVVVLLVSFV